MQPRTALRRDPAQVMVVKRFMAQPSQMKVWRKKEKRGEDEVEATYVRLPVSSVTMDRDGDHFSEAGIKDLVRQFKSGRVPFYLDHGAPSDGGWDRYKALDMDGHWVDAEIEDSLCYATVRGEPGNERFDRWAKKIQNGLPMGASVGFIPKDFAQAKDADGNEPGGLVFNSCDLLECSGVGIPSNPDAVARSRVLAVAKSLGLQNPDAQTTEQLVDTILLALQTALTRKDTPMTGTTQTQTKNQETPEAGAGTAGDEVKGVTLDQIKTALTEALDAKLADLPAQIGKAVGDHVKDALKSRKNDDEEEEEKDDEEEDEEKAAPGGTTKQAPNKREPAKPRGLVTGVQPKQAPNETAETTDEPDWVSKVAPYANTPNARN